MQSMFNVIGSAGKNKRMQKGDRSKKSVAKIGLALLQSAALLVGGAVVSSEASATVSQCSIGNFNTGNGYSGSVWVDKNFYASGSTNCLNYYGDTNYAVVWNNTYHGADALGSMGLGWVNKDIDDVNGNANAWHHHQFASTNTGRAVFALYGWTKDPGSSWYNNEYYIVDNWFGPKPNGRGGQFWQGSISVDDGEYDVYKATGTVPEKPDFVQWWSIRKTPRTSGVISYPQHFQAWRGFGMPNGRMRELRFLMEANGPVGRGKLDVYSIDMLSNAP